MSRRPSPAAVTPASSGRPYVRFHGTRGSVPTPEPENARSGGNTSCVEVGGAAGPLLLLDAGTGIRAAGRALGALGQDVECDVFLTHFHWDHVQGLPFFAPLHRPDSRVRIHAPCAPGSTVAEVFAGLLSPVYFPVPHDGFAARTTMHALAPEPWHGDGYELASLRVRHPSITHGFRIRVGDAAIAYIPDNELAPDTADYRELCDFLRGADLLIHDAMLTDAEYESRRGWGHSTFRRAVRLAEDAEVPRLRLFHHAPDRTDAELERILPCLQRQLVERGSSLELDLAREREIVIL